MMPYLFPVLFAVGLASLVVLCVVARRFLRRADQSPASRNALLMAMTKVPVGPEGSAAGSPGAAREREV